MTHLLQYNFFTTAALGILLTAIATALIGCYVVVRRMVFIAGGVTHSSFAGLGLGFFLGHNPLIYALLASVLSGVAVESLSQRAKVREDSAIAAIWSLGMAIGVLLTFLTPGYTPGLNAFLFGNILLISQSDLVMLSLFVAVSVPLIVIYYHPLLLVCFDSDYARTRGLPVKLIRYLLVIWVCIGIVLSIRAMGIMMLMSMLTLPQMTVNIFTANFKKILIYSSLLSIISGMLALVSSYYLNLPTGAFSIVVLTLIYLIAKGARMLWLHLRHS